MLRERPLLCEGIAYVRRLRPDLASPPRRRHGRQEVATGKERPLNALAGKRGALGRPGLALDARFLCFVREEQRGDIWAAELGQPGAR